MYKVSFLNYFLISLDRNKNYVIIYTIMNDNSI